MLQRELASTYRFKSFLLPQPADAFGELAVTQLTAADGWLLLAAERAK